MNKLPLFQPRLARILGDVLPQPLELRLMPNKMIKRVLLPKPATAAQPPVDLCGREMLP
jgi:hypothetical protein